MIQKTNDEILDALRALWPMSDRDRGLHGWHCEVDENSPACVRLTIGQMYEPPGLNLDKLLQLADFFGTKNIDDERFANGGCESCDYGSDYGFTLVVKPEPAE